MIFPSFGNWSKRDKNRVKESQRRKRRRAFRQDNSTRAKRSLQMESLEDRVVLTSYLFIDYGDSFPSGTLTTTQAGLRDVADAPVDGDKILGTPLVDNAGVFDGTTVIDIEAQTFSAENRSRMFDVVSRAFEALDVTVVDLTSTPQTLADGRTVTAAANMADVVTTLRDGDATAKDAYIFVASFVVDPGGADEITYGPGGGGLSPSNTLGATSDLNAAANNHDDVALVYSTGFSFNTMNNISHEAGHNFGVRHGVTNPTGQPAVDLFHQAEIMSYRNTNNTSSGTFMRFPSIRGDNNTPGGNTLVDYDDIAPRTGDVTNYDQLQTDGGVGPNPNYAFVSGTGAHDIITLTPNGANVDVTVQAFGDAAYTMPITVPGEADSTFSYTVTNPNTILIHAGGSNDRIVINGDLGRDVEIDGMLGEDDLVVDGNGAPLAQVTPDPTPTTGIDIVGGNLVDSYNGEIIVGVSTYSWENFEPTSEFTVEDFGLVEYVTPGSGNDVLTVSVNGGVSQLTGTVDNGTAIMPFNIQTTGGGFAVTTNDGDDQLTVDFGGGNPVPDGGLTFNAGGNPGDDLVLDNGTFDTARHFFDNSTDGRVEVDGDTTDNGGATEWIINYTGLAPIADNLNIANRVFDFGGGNDQDVVVRDDGVAANGLSLIEAPANAETVTFTNPTATMTVNLGSGEDIMELQTLDALWAAGTINLNGGSSPDEIRVAATPAGTTTNIDLGTGVPDDRAVVGALVGSSGTDATNFAQFNTGVSTLDFIGGIVNLEDSGGVGEAYVDDSGDGDADTITFTNASITGASPAAINYIAADFDILQLATGMGNDAINVVSTDASVTTIFANQGNDTFTIAADALDEDNIFRGDEGIDRFVVNIAGDIGGDVLEIHGDDANLNPNQRDSVEINDTSNAPRNLTFNYLDTAGELDVEGFAIPIEIHTVETLIFDDDGENNDTVTIEGTTGVDQLTVAPLTASVAAAFLGGNPWDGPSDAEAFNDAYPGVADGGAGPDILINGIANNSLLVDDGDASTAADDDQLFVYAPSEGGLVDAAATVDPWDPTGVGNGFSQGGVGFLLPAFGNGNDAINVSDANVDILNMGVGPLVDVTIADPTEDFVKTNDAASLRGLIVNTGDETLVGAVADDINAAVSFNFGIQVNGGDPDPSNAPNGDRLNVLTPGEINIFSDKSTPPQVSITTTDPLTNTLSHPLTFSSIENTLLTPGVTNQTVNLFGDNNTAVGQADNFVIVGQDVDSLAAPLGGPAGLALNPAFNPTSAPVDPQFDVDADGDNEFMLLINGSVPIGIRNVTDLNVFGDDDDPVGTASTNFVDTLEITAYADDTPQGWGIDVSFDEGDPAQASGLQADLLIYNTSMFGGEVSEDIVVGPTGVESGELVVTNGSFGTPIVDIDYVFNTDIIIRDNDGFANDTDTLTLLGTNPDTPGASGNDQFVADFANAATPAEPVVAVTDIDTGDILYRVREMTGIQALTIDMLDGADNAVIRSWTGPGAEIDSLNLLGGGGDDNVTFDNTDGLSLINTITYDGGTGSDSLQFTGTTAVTSSTYDVGPTADAGKVTHTLGANSQVVDFTGLEPVIDLVNAATLTVNANGADNAITYGQSDVVNTAGKVSVDGFEPIHFENKTTLVINAGDGDDYISTTRFTPTGLTDITVAAGVADGNDTLERISFITTLTAAISQVTITPSVGFIPIPGSGTLVENFFGADISYTGVDAIQLVGSGVFNDRLDVDGTAGTDQFIYTQGEVFGSGTVTGTVAGIDLPPIHFTGQASARFNQFGNQGGADSFLYVGTDLPDNVVFDGASSLTNTQGVQIANIDIGTTASGGTTAVLGISTGDASDTVSVTPRAGLAIGVFGGQPDGGSDVLNFTGAGAAVTLDTAAQTIQEAGLGVVGYSDIETVNIDAMTAALTVNTGGADDLTIVELGNNPAPGAVDADSGRITTDGVAEQFFFDNAGVLTIDQQGGDDTLRVDYTTSNETITVNVPGLSVSDTLGAFESVNFTANTEALEVFGHEDDDTFNVTPGNIPVFIDGGDPIGTTAGDAINVISGGAAVVFENGPESDEGSFLVAGSERISFDHIEALAVAGAMKAYIAGTNADDDITIIARDASTHAGTDGVQDFTTSVNDGANVLWINTPQLVVDALAGDDDIIARVPAPNDANWNVEAWILGGAPAAGPGDDGDRFEVETPQGTLDHVLWTPTMVDGGQLVIDEANTDAYDPAADTRFNIGILPAPMVGVPVPDVGGVETLVYDGEAGGDTVTVFGTGADDIITHAPGADPDEGTVTVNSLLGILYTDLGGAGTVTIDGLAGDDDAVNVLGTGQNDLFTVQPDGTVLHELSSGAPRVDLLLPVATTEHLVVDALAGDDEIVVNEIQQFDSITVNGGNPDSGSDVLVLNGAAAAVEAVTIAPDGAAGTDQQITGLGAAMFTSGLEVIQYNGVNDDDTLTLNGLEGDHTFRVDNSGVPSLDRVVSDVLPEIQFGQLLSFTIDEAGRIGSMDVTFVTDSLAGAQDYQTVLDEDDTLIIEGTGRSDNYTVTNPAGAPTVAITDTSNGVTVTDLGTGLLNPGPEELVFNTLGGDDTVIVDAGSTDVINPPRHIHFDGGTGADELQVTGDPATAVDEVRYRPGVAVTEGRLTYEDALDTALMTIDFVNLEPVIDTLVAGTLTVLGTNEENDITYTAGAATRGLVTVDGFELIEFNNKGTLALDGQNGNDTILLDHALTPTGLTNVVVNGGLGDDEINVTQLATIATLNGDQGDDLIDASSLATAVALTLNGDAGNDTLIGGIGDDTINGGTGEDLMIGGDPALTPIIGDNTYDGGAGYDTIGILGTSEVDFVDVSQTGAAALVSSVNGAISNEAFTNTEAARIDGELNADVFRLSIADALFDNGANPADTVLDYTVVGGPDGASDRLTVVDDGLGDTVIHRQSRVEDFGSIQIAPAHPNGAANPIVYEGVERIDVTPVNNITGQLGGDGAGRLYVFKADPFEANDQLFNATFLGSGANINLDPTIDPGPNANGPNFPGDQDWYRFVADTTGTLDVQIYFTSQGTLANGRTGLPGNGNLDLLAFDETGNQIAGAGNFGDIENAADDIDERIRIPVVAGQTYYVQVAGGAANADAVNIYNLTAINEAPPIPYDIELNDIVQTGTVNVNAANTTTFSATIAPVNGVLVTPTVANDYIGKTVEFTSGANVGRRAVIANFAGGVFTLNAVGNLLQSAPLAGETFVIETNDTGRSQLDNVTRDNTPIITFRLDDNIFQNDLPGVPAVSDPPDQAIPIPFNTLQTLAPGAVPAVANAGFRVPVFIEGAPQQPGTNPQLPIGYARPLAGVAGVYVFDFGVDAIQAVAGVPQGLTLTDGSHFISAKVEMIDPSLGAPLANNQGWGDRSVSLEIVVDTAAPQTFFGEPDLVGDGLHPDSDSGVNTTPATLVDRVTNDRTPTFFGRAEADSIVRAYIDVNNDNVLDAGDILIGQTVATPIDGTNQHPFGEWELTSTVDMDDPRVLAALGGVPVGGLRNIMITAEDVAGNETPANLPITLQIFIDTQGPRVYDPAGDEGAIYFPVAPAYDVLDPKPTEDGPTPVVSEIRVNIEDLPARAAGFLYAALQAGPAAPVPAIPGAPGALLLPPGSVDLIGDYNGNIPIQDVSWVSDVVVAGQPATGEIVLRFAEPIPDDRFTLTIHDILTDPVGNALDGEFNTDEPPTGDPSSNPPSTEFAFPSGDGTPGGDFVARFTVDTRPEIGTWAAGNIWVDTNGNTTWDPDNPDHVHRDIAYALGFTTDDIFAGNFSDLPGSVADGFDKIGGYGQVNGAFRWLLDTDNDGVVDIDRTDPNNVSGLPFAGDFDGNIFNGDEVGILDGGNDVWWFDTDHDYIVDTQLATTMEGFPFIGDFDGDGAYDLGTWTDDTYQLDLSSVGGVTGTPDVEFRFGFVGVRERPVAHDFNMDGFDDIGLWAPDRTGVTPGEGSEWYILVSGDVDGDGDPSIVDRVRTDPRLGINVIDYMPDPFGFDLYYQFGDNFALPIVGNFDPPVSPITDNPYGGGNMHFNPLNQYDVNGDGFVNPTDLRIVYNYQLDHGAQRLLGSAPDAPYLDVNRDGFATIADLRRELSYLLGVGVDSGEAEGEGEMLITRASTFELVSDDAQVGGESFGASLGTALSIDEPTAIPTWAENADVVFSERDDDLVPNSDVDEVIEDLADDLFGLL